MVFKSRKGLVKLSIETRAELVPCYVFGGTDFFHSLATSDSYLSRLSRKMQVGMTIFWGRWGMPIPFAPRVSMVIGEPIVPPEVKDEKELSKAIDELHEKFMKEMIALFDKYKEQAGYGNAELDIL
jgi:1-acyl-sn-glycerol-3-phosphate acyltransferase